MLLYTLFTLALTWPLAQHFTTHYVGYHAEALHNMSAFWQMWQWAQGNDSLFYSHALYFPHGISMLVHGVGPAVAVLSLPFWPWGPQAAFNGAMLTGLALTGYAMYRLARALGFDRPLSLLAGTLLVSGTPVLVGLLVGHPERVFLLWFIFTLLALHHTLNPQRSPGWAAATGVALLLTLLTNGYLFVFAVAAIALFTAAAWLTAGAGERVALARRTGLLALSCLFFVGPMLYQVREVVQDPIYNVSGKGDVFFKLYHPDAAHFLLPLPYSRFFGSMSEVVAKWVAPGLHVDNEPSVFIPWVAIPLCLLALRRREGHWRWGVWTGLCIIFALGPVLLLLGRTRFTDYSLPLLLPHALLPELPGLDFMRVPSRWMMAGSVGLAIVVTSGTARLRKRFPRYRTPILVAVALLWLIPVWPKSWTLVPPPPTPPFYQQLAKDPESYGVLDLPFNLAPNYVTDYNYASMAAIYQHYQTVHGKSIHAGYLSRFYRHYPNPFSFVQASAVRVNSQLGWPQADLHRNLADQGYRYAVWHKIVLEGTKAEVATRQLVGWMFEGQQPVMEDDMTVAYRLMPDATFPEHTTLKLGANWLGTPYPPRMVSPATVEIHSTQPQQAVLHITPRLIHEPGPPPFRSGSRGTLLVQVNAGTILTVPVQTGRSVAVPLLLSAGDSTVHLILEAGNLPSDDSEPYALEISALDLETADRAGVAGGILINGQPQLATSSVQAFFGSGWHSYEGYPTPTRWADGRAELLLYSPAARTVGLRMIASEFYEPDSATGLGQTGSLAVEANGQVQHEILQSGVEAHFSLALQPGWNTVTLSLATGEFQPATREPGHWDTSILSFSTTLVDIEAP